VEQMQVNYLTKLKVEHQLLQQKPENHLVQTELNYLTKHKVEHQLLQQKAELEQMQLKNKIIKDQVQHHHHLPKMMIKNHQKVVKQLRLAKKVL